MSSDATVDPALFGKLVPLNSLRAENKTDVARKSRLVSSGPGSTIFSRGDSEAEAIWVLEGTVKLTDADGKEVNSITGGEPAAQHRVAQGSPRKLTATCASPVKYLAVESSLLDVMLTWDQTGSFEVTELSSDEDSGSEDWMGRLLTIPTFQMVPPANLQAMFLRMEKLIATPGQVIVQQGDEGDYFYVINDGKAMVTREQSAQKPVRLAELHPGACFGEEALISDAKRNATVTMLTKGSLMRLAKTDFQELLNQPLARKIPQAEGEQMVADGTAVWLDVRLPSEFKNSHLEGAVNIPLYMLRPRLPTLPKNKHYICCCDTGRRSSVAVFVLTQKGYEAYMLEDGIPS